MKHALRSLLKSPGYTALAVGALALGIGANTVLFSAINTLFLRPLAYPEPARLMRVYSSFPDRGLEQAAVSWPRFEAFRDQQDSFAEFSAVSFTGFTLTGRGEPEQVQGLRVSERFLATLGVQPLLGRAFTAAEDQRGGAHVALLNYAFWQNRFGGRSDLVGEAIVLDGRSYTVIGILPPQLGFPFAQSQVWTTRPFEQEGISEDLMQRGSGFLNVYGRLKSNASLARAEEQLRVISRRYGAAFPDKVDAKSGLSVVPMHEDLVGQQRPMFLTLLAAVGCVLLVACANVANLLLARFASRRKEIAIRAALGATRRRIIVQFLTESVLTAALAGALGLLLAVWGINLLARVGEDFIPRANELALDANVLGFAVVLALLTGLALGIMPALQASRADAAESLKDSARGSTGGRRAGKFRSTLLVLEVAVSLVLLVGAALLIDSFRRLQRLDPGFRAENVTTFNLGLPPNQYPTPERQTQLFVSVLERLQALPGVDAVASTTSLPVNGGFARSPVAVEGRPLPPMQERTIPARGTVSPGYFSLLGIPLKQGRDFTWRDREGAPNVMILSESLARRLFPNEDPLGRKLITGIQSIPREIVGVVADHRVGNLAQPPQDMMYYPAMQLEGGFQAIVLRSARPASSLRSEIAAAVHALNPGLPIAEVLPLTELMSRAIADRRLTMALLGGFAGLALVLAGMGIYSVIAYSVAQRTNEFGIRMALGADARTVITMVMKEGLRLALIGLALGLVLSLALTRLMQTLLFEVSASDPVILGSVAIFLSLIAALACWIPARRATKVDPMIALRSE